MSKKIIYFIIYQWNNARIAWLVSLKRVSIANTQDGCNQMFQNSLWIMHKLWRECFNERKLIRYPVKMKQLSCWNLSAWPKSPMYHSFVSSVIYLASSIFRFNYKKINQNIFFELFYFLTDSANSKNRGLFLEFLWECQPL